MYSALKGHSFSCAEGANKDLGFGPRGNRLVSLACEVLRLLLAQTSIPSAAAKAGVISGPFGTPKGVPLQHVREASA